MGSHRSDQSSLQRRFFELQTQKKPLRGGKFDKMLATSIFFFFWTSFLGQQQADLK